MDTNNNSKKSGTIRRRELLKFLGISGAAISSTKAISQIKIGRVIAPNKDNVIAKGQTADVVIQLLRPQDLLLLEFHFFNCTLSGNQIIKNNESALMMVKFQAQSIAESCGTETIVGGNDTLALPDMPAKMLSSNDSRLVFKLTKNLSINVNDLLAWENYELVVNDRAKAPFHPIYIKQIEPNKNLQQIINGTTPAQMNNVRGISKDEKAFVKQQFFKTDTPQKTSPANSIISGLSQLIADPVAPPAAWETALEIPFRLFLSPTKNAGWKHKIKLGSDKGLIKQTNQLFELWHTRMGTKTAKGIDESDLSFEERVLRVLWGEKINKDFNNIPDCKTDKDTDTFLGNTSMNDFYRHQIVHESSNFQIPNFTPQPVQAYKLFLTTLGAYLDSIFLVDRKQLQAINGGKPITEAGPGSKNLALLKWRHIQTLAREHYVELVLAGNIMPFGHEAVLITITERKPHKGSGTATNFKRQLVVITEPTKDYNYRDSNNNFMNFCFHNVEILNTASPFLDSPKKKLVDPSSMSSEEQFIIRSDGQDVQYKMKGEDLNGNLVNFTMPLVFVSSTLMGNPSNITTLIDTYNKQVFVNNATNFNGQKVSLAPLDTSGNGCDTAFAAYEATFGVQPYNSPQELQGYLPKLFTTNIIEPSYQRLTGASKTVPASLVDDKNAGHVFAKFEFAQPVNFGGNADKTGGFAMPNFNLSGLSKAAGAFGGDINKFKNAAADASSYFNVNSMPDPVLFGVFKLSDILDFVPSDKSGYDLSQPLMNRVNSKIPNLTTENLPDAIKTSYVIKSHLVKWPSGGDPIAKFVQFQPSTGDDAFSITTQAIAKKDKSGNPQLPEFTVNAKMKPFVISLMSDLVKVHFDNISFTTSPGKSADININMGNPAIDFGGPLSFINAFQKLIPPGGFSDPPFLDVTTTGVVCGYTLAIPSLQLGAFSLSNLSLGAKVNLPFTGAPLTLGFNFCEKQQPFTLSISILGGGGYFGFEADLHGLRQIDAALEFGACVSLNLGVASGSASVMAGIYFKMVFTDGQNATQLTGYVRINGSLSILGLITASIELYMALTYLIDKHKAYGEASISVKVHVLFFSASVSVHTSRTFAGSGSDPNFQLSYSSNEWYEYCAAFAA